MYWMISESFKNSVILASSLYCTMSACINAQINSQYNTNTLECIDLQHHERDRDVLHVCCVKYQLQEQIIKHVIVPSCYVLSINILKCVHVVLTLYMKETAKKYCNYCLC